MNVEKKYDLIFSLGGSCAAACQLDRRNLRFVSLPLDYTFFRHTSEPIHKLAEAFENDFKNFLLKENLQELHGADRGADHNGKMQYIDTYTKYCWVNHFSKPISEKGEYETVKATIDKRIARLISLLEKAKTVLMIVSNTHEITLGDFNVLTTALKKRFPQLNPEYVCVHFEASNNDVFTQDNVLYINTQQSQNYYDFAQTNFVWRFLDGCKLTGNCQDNGENTDISIHYAKLYLLGKNKGIQLSAASDKIKRIKIMCCALKLFWAQIFSFCKLPTFLGGEKISRNNDNILFDIIRYWR